MTDGPSAWLNGVEMPILPMRLYACKHCWKQSNMEWTPRLLVDPKQVAAYRYECSNPNCDQTSGYHVHVVDAATEWNLHHGTSETTRRCIHGRPMDEPVVCEKCKEITNGKTPATKIQK